MNILHKIRDFIRALNTSEQSEKSFPSQATSEIYTYQEVLKRCIDKHFKELFPHEYSKELTESREGFVNQLNPLLDALDKDLNEIARELNKRAKRKKIEVAKKFYINERDKAQRELDKLESMSDEDF